ncbi:hypothetical protein [Gillisia hiemivivida]|uniref:Uncharacterized protein n=1 Tax=Gillisia hiemivivida TaxID=291190 RepID=A0A5C6ZN43_9FLAO|nr:hypothetical protein [Gillisia hiemivivida]TXD92017.1 hypothetical protein ES724_15135 [Gillisia hiemivivida]
MNFIPFENIELKSSLERDEIINVIKNNIKENTKVGISTSRDSILDFEGYVKDYKFKLKRILRFGYNAFIPIISGEVYGKKNNSIIKLKLKFHKLVSLFLIIITLFIGLLILIPLFESSNTKIKLDKLDKITQESFEKGFISKEKYESLTFKEEKENWNNYVFLITPYILCLIIFNYESRIAKDKFKTMLRINDNIS